MINQNHLYNYKATVVKVVDGDTVKLDIDLGCGVTLSKENVRLFGINAPETRGDERPEGLAAKKYLMSLLSPGDEILIRTYKDKKGKYGRYLAFLYKEEICMNVKMVTEGHAEWKDY